MSNFYDCILVLVNYKWEGIYSWEIILLVTAIYTLKYLYDIVQIARRQKREDNELRKQIRKAKKDSINNSKVYNKKVTKMDPKDVVYISDNKQKVIKV